MIVTRCYLNMCFKMEMAFYVYHIRFISILMRLLCFRSFLCLETQQSFLRILFSAELLLTTFTFDTMF